jgi:hypothetical protein
LPTFRTCASFLEHSSIGNSTAAGAGLPSPGLTKTGAGLPTGLAVPVLETGSPGLTKTGAGRAAAVHFRREGSSLDKLGLVFKNMEV